MSEIIFPAAAVQVTIAGAGLQARVFAPFGDASPGGLYVPYGLRWHRTSGAVSANLAVQFKTSDIAGRDTTFYATGDDVSGFPFASADDIAPCGILIPTRLPTSGGQVGCWVQLDRNVGGADETWDVFPFLLRVR